MNSSKQTTDEGNKMLISSQSYLNEEIVAEKREARDYVVMVSPAFEIDGIEIQVVIDGHHRLAAAIEDGVDPEFVIASVQYDERIALIDENIDDYLEASYIDSNWHDAYTGRNIF